MFVRFLEALNRPFVVAAVLLMMIVVNGFLLYRYLNLSPGESFGETFAPQTVVEERTVERTVLVPDTADPEEAAREDGETEREDDASKEDVEAPPSREERLEERVRPCGEAEDPEPCLGEAVSEVSPGAKLVGGNTEIAAAEPGRNNRVLYYETPGLEPCESVSQSVTAGATYYTVVVVGEGSFGPQADPDCLPGS